MPDDKPASSDRSLEVAATVLSPDSDRAAIMAAETRTVAGGSARAVASSPMPAAIGRYQVVGRIGEGGMGVVYEALDPELKRRVAVKVVRGAGGDAVGQGRLLREAQAMAQLSHASVVPVFDVGALAEADGGGVFIAMELVEGQTLRDWLKSTKRPWTAVVANLVAAGRGLAAAHAAGIVHRDFKPANVLVGMDGRVRVTDFGLARVDDAVFGEGDATGADAGDAHVGTAPGAAARETRTGAIAGTPGYLAPEALDGVIDARGDQFAFCVSLYEGLYGERPFDAGSGEGRSPLVSMAEEVKRGAVREPPRGAKVPGWLRAMVLRGLAADPAARWPSMTALLDAIERVPRRRRQGVLTLLATVVIAGSAALLLAVRTGDQRVNCLTAGRGFDSLWTSAARAQISQVFPTVRAHGAQVAQTVAEVIERWGVRWRSIRVDVCQATHERGEQSADALDRRVSCLDRGLRDLRALVVAFTTPTAATVDRANDAVLTLPDPEGCTGDAPLGGSPLPADARVTETSKLIAEANARYTAGELEPGRKAIETALTLALALGHRGLLGEVRSMYAGYVHESDPDAARKLREQALADAVSSGDTLLEASIVMGLLEEAAIRNTGSIEALLPVARAAAARFPGLPGVQRRFAEVEMLALLQLGQLDDVEDVCRRRETFALTPVEAKICWCAFRLETMEWQAAHDACQEVVELTAVSLGASHPSMAWHLRNVAVADAAMGAHAESLRLRERALAIDEAIWGPDGTRTRESLAAVAAQLADMDRAKDALPYLDRVVAIGARDPRVDQIDVNMAVLRADVLMAIDDPEAARRASETALQMAEKFYAAGHPNLLIGIFKHGFVNLAAGRCDVALPIFEKGLAAAAAALGDDHVFAGYNLIGMADCLVKTERASEALAHGKRAVEILEAALADPINVSEAHRVYGVALARQGDRALARRELLRALELLDGLGDYAKSYGDVLKEELAKLAQDGTR